MAKQALLVDIDSSVKESLRLHAKRLDRSVSSLVRVILRDWLDSAGPVENADLNKRALVSESDLGGSTLPADPTERTYGLPSGS